MEVCLYLQPRFGAPDWPPSNVTTTIYQPFSITSFALALLMVFRTNSSYARCAPDSSRHQGDSAVTLRLKSSLQEVVWHGSAQMENM